MKYTLPKGKYKDVKEYADKVYQLNQQQIDEKLDMGDDRLTANKLFTKNKTLFREHISMEYNMYRYDPTYNSYTDTQLMKRATETVFNSEMFTPVNERLSTNFLTGIKRRAPELYRQLSRDASTGRYTKIDPTLLTYDADATTQYGVLAAYRYGNLLILLKQSPSEYIII